MRKFLGTLVILGMIVAGVGFYRGWFGVSTNDQPDVTNVEVTIDKERIKQDVEAATEKARELAADHDGSTDVQADEPGTQEDPTTPGPN
jgi:hypothetical protein